MSVRRAIDLAEQVNSRDAWGMVMLLFNSVETPRGGRKVDVTNTIKQRPTALTESLITT